MRTDAASMLDTWDALESITEVRSTEGCLTVMGATGSGRSATVEFTFLESGGLRVRGIAGHHGTCMPSVAGPINDRYVISCGVHRLIVRARPFRWHVEDCRGRFVAGESDDDVNVANNPRVKPLGMVLQRTASGSNNPPCRGWRGAFRLRQDERVYGLGEKFTPLDRRCQHIESWNVDAYGTGSEKAYKNVPFFWTNMGWGCWFNTSCRVVHDVSNPEYTIGSYIFSIDHDELDMYLFFGTPAEIIAEYSAITGRTPVPPYWSFGIWMSRCYYESQHEVEQVAREIRERGVPCDCLTMDGRAWLDARTRCDFVWDSRRVPDPQGLIDALHGMGFRLCLWEYPYISVHSDAFNTLAHKGCFMRTAGGEPYVFHWSSEGFNEYLTLLPPSAIVDMTNPEAREWYRAQHVRLLEAGVDVFKTDFGEQIPEDCHAWDGRTGREVHNEYALLYNELVYDVTGEYGRSGPLVFGRSGWSGSQRYPVQWGGDAHATWEGMSNSLRGGLGYACSGVPFWTSDVGGFYGPKPDPELYIRWVQFGSMCSFMRCHGTTPREPWAFGDTAVEVFRKFARVRYMLLPYIYAAAVEASETGMPVMRPLSIDHGDDPIACAREDQYMLGPTLLVAPILKPGGRRTVYLPEGEWVDFWSGALYHGRTVFQVECPLDSMPVFGKLHGTIPIGPAVEHIQTDYPEIATSYTFVEGGNNPCAQA